LNVAGPRLSKRKTSASVAPVKPPPKKEKIKPKLLSAAKKTASRLPFLEYLAPCRFDGMSEAELTIEVLKMVKKNVTETEDARFLMNRVSALVVYS
jgi:hypothetical protein